MPLAMPRDENDAGKKANRHDLRGVHEMWDDLHVCHMFLACRHVTQVVAPHFAGALCHIMIINYVTLWLFNIAMENHHF